MATYYVDPVSGNNGNAGTSFGAAWATTQKAADTAVAGDIVLLCATGDESITAKIDMDTNAGTAITPIKFKGANSSGTVDGTKYTIKVTSGTGVILDFTATADFTYWQDVIFDGNSAAPTAIYNNVDGSDYHTFVRCQVKGCTSHGVNIRGNSTYQFYFYGCRINNNGGAGINHSAGNRGKVLFFGGCIDNNSGGGWNVDANVCDIRNSLIYRNTGVGLLCGSNSNGSVFINNVFYANTTAGLQLYNATSRTHYIITGNCFAANGTYGIQFQTGNEFTALYCDYNSSYSNTSGATDLSGNLLPGNHNITADPLFANVGAGTEDFRLASGSPLIAAGAGGVNIGALGQVPGSAGGGLIRHPGMNGGLNG